MDFHIHVHIDWPQAAEILRVVKELQGEIKQMAINMDTLIDDVTQLTTVSDGLSLVIDELIKSDLALAAQLKAAGNDPTKIAAVHQAFLANTQKLATKKQAILDAITANTGSLAVTSINPATGSVGSSVAIAGSGFGATQGSSTVTFGGIDAGPAPSWSESSIVVNVPAGAVTGDLVVTVNGQSTAPGTTFTVV